MSSCSCGEKMKHTLCSRISPTPSSRREFLAQSEPARAGETTRVVHHPPKAKHVIQLFMLGGASQCDTFDYKPELIRRHGEAVNFTVTGGTAASPGPLLNSPW